MNSEQEVLDLFEEYWKVSSAWRGLGEGMTIDQGLKRLASITSQTLSPLLARKARELTREIVLGRNYSSPPSSREVM